MTFLDFVMFMLDVILGHAPLTSPLLSSVQAFRLRLYESNVQASSTSHSLALQSDVQTSFSAYQAFRLRLYMDKMFRLHLHHIH